MDFEKVYKVGGRFLTRDQLQNVRQLAVEYQLLYFLRKKPCKVDVGDFPASFSVSSAVTGPFASRPQFRREDPEFGPSVQDKVIVRRFPTVCLPSSFDKVEYGVLRVDRSADFSIYGRDRVDVNKVAEIGQSALQQLEAVLKVRVGEGNHSFTVEGKFGDCQLKFVYSLDSPLSVETWVFGQEGRPLAVLGELGLWELREVFGRRNRALEASVQKGLCYGILPSEVKLDDVGKLEEIIL